MKNHAKSMSMTASELDNLILSKVRQALSEQANSPTQGRTFQAQKYLSILIMLVRILDFFLKIDFMDIATAMQSLFPSW